MNLLFKRSITLFITLNLLFPYAAFAAEFNPNFLLSDEELQNWQSMSIVDIQAFLENHESSLSTLKIADAELKERPVSYIIGDAAQKHRINPKYLLVKLQKEQSLITEKNPTQKQLDGATGYGITDGCGWSCATYLNNQGFGKQVDSAAAIMRWYYDNLDKETWIKRPQNTYSIDNQTVQPATLATAFLYTYTPHIEGNANFWRLWQKWFKQVYPDGTLIKSDDSSTVYLIQNGGKRPFANMTALTSRYNPKLMVTAPASELNRYETGAPISLPNYAVIKQGTQFYLTDFQTLRPFADESVVRALGYHPDEIIEVTENDIQGLSIGTPITATQTVSPLGKLIRIKENNQLYYLNDGKYHPMFDEQIAKITFPHLAIEKATAAILADYPEKGAPIVFKDGTIFGIQGSNRIYVVENGKKRHIASEAVYNGLGYNWGNIIWTNDFAGMAHQNGEPIYLREGEPPPVVTIVENTPKETTLNPQSTTEGKMVITPPEQTMTMGPIFDTPIDTYLVADYTTGEILAGKNIDTLRPMASFVKVMTGYRLLKEGMSLVETSLYDANKHKAYGQFRTVSGERFNNKDLMDALLVSSLNTPARMLVGEVEPQESLFVARMNIQAREWGLPKTTMTDVHGYDTGNVTTAREYLTLFTKAVENIDIRGFLGTKYYEYDELIDKDGKPHHHDYHTNLIMEKDGLPFTIIASKTGYLDESGANLVMLVERPSDGKRFIVLTMGNADYRHRFDEPEKLARWALSL